jgi:hypothetical protein
MERIGQITACAGTGYDQLAMSRLIHAIDQPDYPQGFAARFRILAADRANFGRRLRPRIRRRQGRVGSPVRSNNLACISVSRLVAGFYEVIR